MKSEIKILIGIAIATLAWVPMSFADRGDIPFGAAIIGIVGSVTGGILAVVAGVQWLLTPRKRRAERE